MKNHARDTLRGTVLAGLAVGASFLLAHYAFGRLFYLGILLAATLVGMLLVAWLIHLKTDGFFGRSRREETPPPDRDHPYASFDDPVLPRGSADPREVRPWDSLDVMRALLWAAAELAVVSAALYHFAGIGSRF
jgi:hypothetical protein